MDSDCRGSQEAGGRTTQQGKCTTTVITFKAILGGVCPSGDWQGILGPRSGVWSAREEVGAGFRRGVQALQNATFNKGGVKRVELLGCDGLAFGREKRLDLGEFGAIG
jgi:hypothetical protein